MHEYYFIRQSHANSFLLDRMIHRFFISKKAGISDKSPAFSIQNPFNSFGSQI